MYVAQKMKLTVVHAKKKVKWSSTNSAVASVKKSGKTSAIITANTAGTAQITAKIGKKKLVCKVTVQNRPVTVWYDDAHANDFVARINAARTGASYSGFTTTDALTQIARAHAAALVTNFAKGSLAANQDEMVLKSNAYYAYTLETGENLMRYLNTYNGSTVTTQSYTKIGAACYKYKAWDAFVNTYVTTNYWCIVLEQ